MIFFQLARNYIYQNRLHQYAGKTIKQYRNSFFLSGVAALYKIAKRFYYVRNSIAIYKTDYDSFLTIPNPPCPRVPYVAGGSNSFPA
jgi:hypothetical protein